jgi:hypothetical protein
MSANYAAIVQLGRQLESQEWFKHAAAVYAQGLQYYPGDKDLIRRQQVADSTWKEAERLTALLSGGAAPGAGATDVRFAVIKCQRLSGASAIAACQHAAALDPANPVVYQRLGDELTRAGRVAEAQSAYHKARALGLPTLGGPGGGPRPAPAAPPEPPSAAAPQPSRAEPAAPAQDSLAAAWSTATLAQLQMLDRLRHEGYITDREYAKRKQQLLDAVLLAQPEAPATPQDDRHLLHGIELGKFYALLIGNNDYQHLPKLQMAIADAAGVGILLENEYGFHLTTLFNANRYQMLSAISRLRAVLTERDNLLIYYTGHGELDLATGRGYWLPIDAERDNYANWLATTEITDHLQGMKARHVLIVADSCFSGTLLRGSGGAFQAREDRRTVLRRLATKRSRTVLTSGGLEPVLDAGGGANSVFTKAFLTVLLANAGVLEGSQLFDKLRGLVVVNAEQTPEYAPVHKAGHEGGDFLFVRRR